MGLETDLASRVTERVSRSERSSSPTSPPAPMVDGLGVDDVSLVLTFDIDDASCRRR